ncbi:MAG: thiamine diphosphokinase [Oscillospiraceae bacterium]|nr:thiamine diphosphokinase [Oscillospiraceae bacterium]
MEKICHIAGAAETGTAVVVRRPGDLVIAADGGLALLKRLGVEPDLTLGDFDSLGLAPTGKNVVRHPPEKDDTDMLLAVREGLRRGYRVFSIVGGLGGRLSHTLANIQTLLLIAGSGGVGFLHGDGTVVTAVKDGVIRFPAGRTGLVSVFSAGERAEGVTERGLKYRLDGAVLTNDRPLGVSNEFTGEEAEIAVERGSLIVIWAEDGFDPASSGITTGGPSC